MMLEPAGRRYRPLASEGAPAILQRQDLFGNEAAVIRTGRRVQDENALVFPRQKLDATAMGAGPSSEFLWALHPSPRSHSFYCDIIRDRECDHQVDRRQGIQKSREPTEPASRIGVATFVGPSSRR